MKVLSTDGRLARVSAGGLETNVSVVLVDDLAVGDYVIVHAGYAIQRMSAAEAHETLAILERLDDLAVRG